MTARQVDADLHWAREHRAWVERHVDRTSVDAARRIEDAEREVRAAEAAVAEMVGRGE